MSLLLLQRNKPMGPAHRQDARRNGNRLPVTEKRQGLQIGKNPALSATEAADKGDAARMGGKLNRGAAQIAAAAAFHVGNNIAASCGEDKGYGF
jgi:hypothetical protein